MINKRRALCISLAAIALSLWACRSHKSVSEVDEPGDMVSTLPMYDPHAGKQLVSGFYDLENGAWRWTAPKFSVDLLPPAQAATKGAKLTLRLVLTDQEIQQLNNLTVSAKVGDTTLPPETYNKSGSYTYTRDVPAAALATNSVHIDFWLDKSLPPVGNDRRQLGIVVSQVGLEAK